MPIQDLKFSTFIFAAEAILKFKMYINSECGM